MAGPSIRLGLRSKLALICLAWVCIPLLVVWGAGVYENLSRRLTAQEVSHIASQIESAIVTESLTASDLAQRGGWLRELGREEQVMIRVIDGSGAVLHDSNPPKIRHWSGIREWYHGAGDLFFGPSGPPDLLAFETSLPPEPDRPEVRAALNGEAASKLRFDDSRRMVIDYRALPIPNGGGAVYLTQMSRRSILALYDLRYQFLKLTLVLAIAAAVIGIWLGRRFVSPLVAMQRRIRAYVDQVESPSEATTAQLSLARTDEIGDLSRDFRELAERLQQKVRRSSEMAADLAHDLKNPIATVSASAELLDSSNEMSRERQQRIAAAMAEAAVHMNRSVEGMLQIARLDHTLASSRHTPFDLSTAVREALDAYDAHSTTAGAQIDAAVESGLGITGIRDQLLVAIRNLVDNALLFCRSRVRVGLRQQDEELVLVVEDDGPGVSDGNREKLFRRFFTQRPENAPPGTGLGLAIARTIAVAHGGDLTLADSGSLSGATFVLRLPRLAGAGATATEMPQ